MPGQLDGKTWRAALQRLQQRGFWKSMALFFALIGPGIITSNVDNDAGGITTYSLAGAEFGLSLLWILAPTTVALIIIQEMCARMGVVSGKGLSDLIRERFGARTTFYLMIVLFLTNLGNTISEFAGVAASMLMRLPTLRLMPCCAALTTSAIAHAGKLARTRSTTAGSPGFARASEGRQAG